METPWLVQILLILVTLFVEIVLIGLAISSIFMPGLGLKPDTKTGMIAAPITMIICFLIISIEIWDTVAQNLSNAWFIAVAPFLATVLIFFIVIFYTGLGYLALAMLGKNPTCKKAFLYSTVTVIFLYLFVQLSIKLQ